jgi:hypothetical protein
MNRTCHLQRKGCWFGAHDATRVTRSDRRRERARATRPRPSVGPAVHRARSTTGLVHMVYECTDWRAQEWGHAGQQDAAPPSCAPCRSDGNDPGTGRHMEGPRVGGRSTVARRAEQLVWCGVVRSPLLPGQQAGLALWVAPGCDRTLGTVKQDRSRGASELGREPSLLPSVVDPIHEANGSLVRSFVPRCC